MIGDDDNLLNFNVYGGDTDPGIDQNTPSSTSGRFRRNHWLFGTGWWLRHTWIVSRRKIRRPDGSVWDIRHDRYIRTFYRRLRGLERPKTRRIGNIRVVRWIDWLVWILWNHNNDWDGGRRINWEVRHLRHWVRLN